MTFGKSVRRLLVNNCHRHPISCLLLYRAAFSRRRRVGGWYASRCGWPHGRRELCRGLVQHAQTLPPAIPPFPPLLASRPNVRTLVRVRFCASHSSSNPPTLSPHSMVTVLLETPSRNINGFALYDLVSDAAKSIIGMIVNVFRCCE